MREEKTLTREDVKEFLKRARCAGQGVLRIDERLRIMGLSDTPPEPGSLAGAVAARIALRREALSGIVARVAAAVELLPDGSVEKNIVQMRHLKGMMWEDIKAALHYRRRSTCLKHYQKALDQLLACKPVRETLARDLPPTPSSDIHKKGERIRKNPKARKDMDALLSQYRRIARNIRYFEQYLHAADTRPKPESLCAAISAHIGELREKLLELVLRVMDVMDVLPDDSLAKVIMEIRYLDGMEWGNIGEILDFKPLTCKCYCLRGEDWLLGDERVRELVAEPLDSAIDKNTQLLKYRIRNGRRPSRSKRPLKARPPRKAKPPRKPRIPGAVLVARRTKLEMFLKRGADAYKGIRRLDKFRRAIACRKPDALTAAVAERIALRRKKLAQTVLLLMDVIDLLPDGSTEKEVLKMRYLNDMPWKQIVGAARPDRRVTARGRAPQEGYETLLRKALNRLLDYERVRELLDETPVSPVAEERPRVCEDRDYFKKLNAFLNQLRESDKDIERLRKRCYVAESDSLAAEFETHAAARREELLEAALRAMDIIDLLPDESADKDIMEMRTFGDMEWEEIGRAVNFRRDTCMKRYARTLDWLLTHESVRKFLDDAPDSAADGNTQTT